MQIKNTKPSPMHLSSFDFALPEHLIAQYPLPQRSASRLLHLDRNTGVVAHRQFTDLIDLLTPNDLLVFNNTRVIPARLHGAKATGGHVEILVEKILDQQCVLAQIKNSKTLKIGALITLAKSFTAEVMQRKDNFITLKFHGATVMQVLNTIGHIPLPPYISRDDEVSDHERYQTVYATQEGAVAAPTAGLHFDRELLQQLTAKKIPIAFITLHVGAGTFQPVRVENIAEHKMHAEYIEVPESVCEQINACKKRNGRVIAVGTTTVRSLETAAANGDIKSYHGETDIFIYPGYQFRCIDAMITNFHLPKSSLLMLVCAFAGYKNAMSAYQVAITNSYRFFSYGDAMLILSACLG